MSEKKLKQENIMKKIMRLLSREQNSPTSEQMLIEFNRRAKNDAHHPAHRSLPPAEYRGYDCVEHAANLLSSLQPGEKVVIEGNCPSGTTYTGYATWDGTMSTAQEILVSAWNNSVGAARGWLQKQSDCSHGIWSAQLRTG